MNNARKISSSNTRLISSYHIKMINAQSPFFSGKKANQDCIGMKKKRILLDYSSMTVDKTQWYTVHL